MASSSCSKSPIGWTPRSLPIFTWLVTLSVLSLSAARVSAPQPTVNGQLSPCCDVAGCHGSPLSAVALGHEEDSTRPRSRRAAFVPYRRGAEVAEVVSRTLDQVLDETNYDKQVRPALGGDPVQVQINFDVKSMGPVDENTMSFSLDAYFRQSWFDRRLQYNATGVTQLVLNWAFLSKIWVPDTFLINGKHSYLHKITVPNQFVRISPAGRVSYSQRLTITAECRQNLRKFPLDTQMCPLRIGSYGYDAKDVIFSWMDPAVELPTRLGMAQFDLYDSKTGEKITTEMERRTRSGIRNDSIAFIEFYFQRQTGFYMLQIYTPLILIVMCSWVTFWLIKTDKGGEVPARTALGANSVLSVVNIGFGGKSRPQVRYATAMDVFIILCFSSVFFALCEFALINFLDTLIKNKKKKEKEKEEAEKQRTDKAKVLPLLLMSAIPTVDVAATLDVNAIQNAPASEESEQQPLQQQQRQDDGFESVDDEDEDEAGEKKQEGGGLMHRVDLLSKSVYDAAERWIERHYGPITELYIYRNTTEVMWSIDEWARIIFPFLFFLQQCLYWTVYLHLYETTGDD